MWSKPAPPSDSGMAMPVRPSSAAFLKLSRGKWPVSSSSLASGRTSDAANSRTVFSSSACSSVRSRFMCRSSLAQKKKKIYTEGTEKNRLRRRLGEGLAQALIRNFEFFGVNTGLARHGHEVGIAEPAGQDVKMQMAGDAGSCCAAQVHAEIHTVGLVICLESFLDALRKLHHLAECFGITQAQFRDVRVRHDHDVPGGVWKTIEDNEGLRAAISDECFVVLVERDGVAKNAVGLLPCRYLLHVLVAPRRPEIVHRAASLSVKVARTA